MENTKIKQEIEELDLAINMYKDDSKCIITFPQMKNECKDYLLKGYKLGQKETIKSINKHFDIKLEDLTTCFSSNTNGVKS